ncbi:MAG: hypothetical protein LBO69_01225 [Ignavibacteria bacterium]|jgi:hypothetical protein|nr:hypothetical protein [Ignavibacteria bacterium]
MSHKYVLTNRKEIGIFRNNKAIKERRRQEITDSTLIALRRVHLALEKEHPALAHQGQQIVLKLKTLPHKRAVDIFNYYLADIQ